MPRVWLLGVIAFSLQPGAYQTMFSIANTLLCAPIRALSSSGASIYVYTRHVRDTAARFDRPASFQALLSTQVAPR